MTNEFVLKVISENRVFAGAGERTLSALLSCRRETFSTGDEIYSTDNFRKSFGIVLSGKVEIFGAADGKKVRLNSISRGDNFGAAALFGANGGYVSTVRAKTNCSILFISEDEMRKFITDDPHVAILYVTFLSEKIRFLNGKITSFTAKNADSAVAGYLAEQKSDVILVNMSRLSRQLDIGRTSLYRSFDNLSQLGAISYSDRTVTIISRKILDSVRNT